MVFTLSGKSYMTRILYYFVPVGSVNKFKRIDRTVLFLGPRPALLLFRKYLSEHSMATRLDQQEDKIRFEFDKCPPRCLYKEAGT